MSKYAVVALPGMPHLLTYCNPESFSAGTRVAVSVRNRIRSALLWSAATELPQHISAAKILTIVRSLDKPNLPFLNAANMAFLVRVTQYYGVTPGYALQNFFPSTLFPELQDGFLQKQAAIEEADGSELNKHCIVINKKLWLPMDQARKHNWHKKLLDSDCAASRFWLRYPTHTRPKSVELQSGYYLATPVLQEARPRGSQQKAAFKLWANPEGSTYADLANLYKNPAPILQKALKSGWLRQLEEPPKAVVPPNTVVDNLVKLSAEQHVATKSIIAAEPASTHLLLGPTGSGKSEVIFHAIAETIKSNQQVLLLLPEIGIATQMYKRVQQHFTGVALYHSGLSKTMREKTLQAAADGQIQILVGARSALFCPLQNIGLVVVDEEHESGYKAPDAPYLHGRNMALLAAKIHAAKTLLCSATPSLESWHNTQLGRHQLHKLSTKHHQATTEVKFVPALCRYKPSKQGFFIPEIQQHIEKALAAGHQVAILRNRRGLYRYTDCTECGQRASCPNCPQIPLVQHGTGKQLRLVCHICGFKKDLGSCTHCNSDALQRKTSGTQRWEQHLEKHFPNSEVVRIDSDATGGYDAWLDLYNKLYQGQNQILIGTQMLAKGFDLPNLTTLLVTEYDTTIDYPDPKAWERAYALLTQAIGRVGRRDINSTVFIESRQEQHPVYQYAIREDTVPFMAEELARRKQAGFPPIRRAAIIYHYSKSEPDLAKIKSFLTACQQQVAPQLQGEKLDVFGPLHENSMQLANLFRTPVYVFADSISSLHLYCERYRNWYHNGYAPKWLQQVRIDYDPISFT